MEPSPRQVDILQQSLRQSRDLTRLLVDVDRLTQDGAASIQPLLVCLRPRLEDHFRGEESSGLFDVLLDRLPSESEELDRLRSEHAAFLARLDDLAVALDQEARCPSAFAPPASDSNRETLGTLLRGLRDHERRECSLIQEAYTHDMRALDT